MIEEQYVDFDTARLLKVKGFRAKCNRYYNAQYGMIRTVSDTFMMDFNDQEHMKSIGMEGAVNIPTQQMAMRWLREEHNIDISIEPHSHSGIKTVEYEFTYWYEGYYHAPYQEKTPNYHPLFGKTYNTYEQACDAAIKYCLENLI